MSSMKQKIKNFLEQQNLYLRKISGMSSGQDVYIDLLHKYKVDIKLAFDVGAHKGETLDDLKNYYDNSVVHCFEPIQNNFSLLKQKAAQYKYVTVNDFALSNNIGSIIIEKQKDSQTNSLKFEATESTLEANTEQIQVNTLNAYTKEVNITKIDLLKIDVEGFELQVLEGGSNLLQNNSIHFIFLEASLDPQDKLHSNLYTIQNFLDKYNFKLCGIYDQVVWYSPSRLAYFNALFINDKFI
jgi:FkbM family methyltransferase